MLGLGVRIPPEAWLSVMNVLCCHIKVSVMGQSFVQRTFPKCVCVSLSVIMSKNSTVHLHRDGRRGWTKKERKIFYPLR